MPRKQTLFIESQHTVREIHQAIRENQTTHLAAKALNFNNSFALSAHLGRFNLDGEVLNASQLRALPIKRAEIIFGRLYDREMKAPVINLKHYSGAHLDYIVKNSDSIQDAANKLGVGKHALSHLLAQYNFQGHELTFSTLQSLPESDVQHVFGADYAPIHPEQRYNLTPMLPMAYSFASHQLLTKKSNEDIYDFDSLEEILPEGLF